MKTVKQMKQSLPTGKLLSNYNSDFWTEYKNNYNQFDNYFVTLYKSFVFFDQEENETIEEVTSNFTNAVENYLRVNDKRLNELWRINVVNDDKYDILNNVDETIEQTTNVNGQSTLTTGSRTDVSDVNIGNQKFDSVNKVTPYNSNNETTDNSNSNESGTRNDVETFTKGLETDTSASANNTTFSSRRYGNIGVMTSTQIMNLHREFWEKQYNFYMFVFSEICKYLLLIGD